MPLADEMRPKTLQDVIGQQHLLGPGKALTRLVSSGHLTNMVFYGPPGVGKTTVARILAESSGLAYFMLNATTITATQMKCVLADAETKGRVLLYLDEIQYLTKRQQQTLLAAVESGQLILLASTTENPYFCLYRALLSRCTVLEFMNIQPADLKGLILRAFQKMSETTKIKYTVDPNVIDLICTSNGGDVRKCLNTVELLASTANADGKVTHELAEDVAQATGLSCAADSDEHYDVLSALHKSIRGSDVDAALHYAARLIIAGDLTSICRRLLAIASEDVGLAYPQAVSIVKSCVDSAVQLGLPEAKLPLAEAVILLATSPKSNSVVTAIDAALVDLKTCGNYDIPRHLQNTHCDGVGSGHFGQNYKYPHDYPNHYVKQQYLPNALVGHKYYTPGCNKFEQEAEKYWKGIK